MANRPQHFVETRGFAAGWLGRDSSGEDAQGLEYHSMPKEAGASWPQFTVQQRLKLGP